MASCSLTSVSPRGLAALQSGTQEAAALVVDCPPVAQSQAAPLCLAFQASMAFQPIMPCPHLPDQTLGATPLHIVCLLALPDTALRLPAVCGRRP